MRSQASQRAALLPPLRFNHFVFEVEMDKNQPGGEKKKTKCKKDPNGKKTGAVSWVASLGGCFFVVNDFGGKKCTHQKNTQNAAVS